MDLTAFQPWLKYLHIAGAFLFVAGHGVSMVVMFRLRRERDTGQMLGLLDLSASSLSLAIAGLLLLLVSGIVAGIVGGYFGRWWIWLALVLLVAMGILMTPLARAHLDRLRQALGQRTRDMKSTEPDPVPLPADEVIALTAGRWPEVAALVGGGTFLVILWLMTFKPF